MVSRGEPEINKDLIHVLTATFHGSCNKTPRVVLSTPRFFSALEASTKLGEVYQDTTISLYPLPGRPPQTNHPDPTRQPPHPTALFTAP